jgi:chorismate-pyruvate lyase
MNPRDELQSLIDLFPSGLTLIERFEHVPSASVPEPYRSMLVHNHHMTIAMESYHRSPVEVRVLDRKLVGDNYCRKIVLLKQGTNQVVQFGLVRFDLRTVSEAVREEILGERIPLGRVLINHEVHRQVDLGAVLRITAGPELAECLQMPRHAQTYGRLATIFCNGQPAVDLLEITAPLASP